MYRRNADRRCRNVLEDGEECQLIQTIVHLFQDSSVITDANSMAIHVLNEILVKDIGRHQFLFFDISHNNLHRLRCALWFAVKVLYRIYQDRCFNKGRFKKIFP